MKHHKGGTRKNTECNKDGTRIMWNLLEKDYVKDDQQNKVTCLEMIMMIIMMNMMNNNDNKDDDNDDDDNIKITDDDDNDDNSGSKNNRNFTRNKTEFICSFYN